MKNINPEDREIKNRETEINSGTGKSQRSLLRTLLILLVAFAVNDILVVRPLTKKFAERQREKLASSSENDGEAEEKEDDSREFVIELGGGKTSADKTSEATRYVFLENDYVRLRLDTRGLVLDNLFLKKYSDEIGDIRLLEPRKNTITIGWQNVSGDSRIPPENSLWLLESREFSEAGGPARGVNLALDSGTLKFKIRLFIDEKYMLRVEQTVENLGKEEIFLRPFWQIRKKNPKIKNRHELFHFNGGLGVSEGRIPAIKSKKIKNTSLEMQKASWVGITSQYWLVALIGDNSNEKMAIFSEKNNTTTVLLTSPTAEKVAQNSSITSSVDLFTGAKDIEVLKNYSKSKNIKFFDRSIDFGFFYFLARPLNGVLNFMYKIIGNFGLAIILLTLIIKMILYPSMKKSFVTIDIMKEVQPKIKELQTVYGRDSEKFRREIIKIYDKYNLNPFSSIVPILIQIPVFFSLYRVISVSLNMRQAPFFWFIRDLSVADPTNILNLFGLLPYRTRIKLGFLPCLMALTMYLQQKFSDHMTNGTWDQPKAAGSSNGTSTGIGNEIATTNSKLAKLTPLIFLFIFSSFPSGLLIYWIVNNIVTVVQQYYIFKNIRSRSKKRED
ncbi:MAG: membrane protein insertase YidC [Rickettsiales bacterium]|jgi:YidC/Oxa1 family membrane protein insertase|nr:membrane protein insertase YidC [Rickettsiales bacterium]